MSTNNKDQNKNGSINLERRPADKWEKTANWDHKYRHQNMSVDVDVWYPMLKSLTFNTYFVHLTHREALAIVHFYLYKFVRKKVFTFEDSQVIINLEKKIDHYFQTIPDLKDGALFRCTGRSGKDGEVYDNSKILNEYYSRLKKVTNLSYDEVKDPDIKYSCIPMYNNMKVTNGKELLNVLLTSERLHHDMKDWVIHGGREQIVLRKWDDRLRAQDEFRVFVRNGKICASCQYDRYGKYDELIKNRETIEKKINDFFYNKLEPLMKIKDYAVDFGYINNEIVLIEFSPLIRCTSARLFRWDANYKEMTEGEGGKLTVREESYEGIDYYVKEWEDVYKEPNIPYDKYLIKDEKDNEEESSGITKYLNYINPINIYKSLFLKRNENFEINSIKEEKLINKKIIFVCSVLKDGFYWSKKYIRYDDNKNQLLGEGTLNNHIIQIDKNGFGWIVEKGNSKCKGEVFEVDDEDFIDIEYYYGSDDEKMKEVNVQLKDKEIKAFAFIVKSVDKKLINDRGVIEVENYDLDIQNKYFNPMEHIINQQEKYLNMSLDFNFEDKW